MIIRLMAVNWLNALGTLVSFFGAFIALFIGIYAYKAFKATEKREYKLLALSFFLIAFQALIYATVLPLLYIFYNKMYFSLLNLEIIFTTYKPILLQVSHIINFLFILTTLTGYTLLAYLYSKIESKSLLILLGSLVFALTIYSFSYVSFIGFNLTSILLLGYVSYHTIKNYNWKKNRNALYIAASFSLILLSHLLFVASEFFFSDQTRALFSLLGPVSQLAGYLSLFIVLIRAQYGKKK